MVTPTGVHALQRKNNINIQSVNKKIRRENRSKYICFHVNFSIEGIKMKWYIPCIHNFCLSV